MQIPSKKEVTSSPSTGAATEVRKGNIAKWASLASLSLGYPMAGDYQIGGSLKLRLSGKPVRIRANFKTQFYDGTVTGNASHQMSISIRRFVNGVSTGTVNSFSATGILLDIGGGQPAAGTEYSHSFNFTDNYAFLNDDVVEYKLYAFTNVAFFTTSHHDVSVYSFEIEEVV